MLHLWLELSFRPLASFPFPVVFMFSHQLITSVGANAPECSELMSGACALLFTAAALCTPLQQGLTLPAVLSVHTLFLCEISISLWVHFTVDMHMQFEFHCYFRHTVAFDCWFWLTHTLAMIADSDQLHERTSSFCLEINFGLLALLMKCTKS